LNPEDVCKEWNDRQVYWATLAYARWWLAVDGPFLGAMKAEREFTVPILRAVARRYNVNRGLLREDGLPDDQDPSADGMIGLLNNARKSWSEGLPARAQTCATIAAEALANGWTQGLQVSAASKFMWFLEPAGWTMFDQFAATGMGFPHPTPNRFLNFYKTLEGQGFDDMVQTMRSLIAKSLLPDLPAERIIDSLLMARGGRGCEQHDIDESTAFLALLPPDFRKSLHDLATDLQRKMADAVLVRAV
jgi:hypothetical protein